MEQAFEFEIGQLLPIGLTILVLGIALAFGLQVMGEIRDDQALTDSTTACGTNSTGGTAGTILWTNCSRATNATMSGIEGVSKIPEKLPLIVTVVVAAVIIGVIVSFLMVRK